jgi:putative restriction endonuclease
MTSWVLWISKDYPQHWSRAVGHSLWDMLRVRDVKAGDNVYFWQAGNKSRLLGWTRATTTARPLAEGEVGPWEDASTAPYLRRFHLQLVSEHPRRSPKWGEVASATGLTPAPMSGIVSTSDPAAESYLAALFDPPSVAVDLRFDDAIQVSLEDLLEDTRDRATRTIALRRGQRDFRSALLTAYRRRCAVTGYTTEDVLEAAHISPHRGTHTNVVANGLLLRADIHTLFDVHLLTITTDLRVRVSPALKDSPYMDLDNQPLQSRPDSPDQLPAAECLQGHHEECTWYDDESLALF